MVPQWLAVKLKISKNFFEFAVNFAKKKLAPKVLLAPLTEGLKEVLTIYRRKKLAKYRLDCQIYRLNQMENAIAQSNKHYFIQGRKIDDIR